MYNPNLARTNMVLSQIAPTAILSASLYDTLLTTPRHIFVPKHLQGIAYMDNHIALGNNRYLMSPSLFAQLAKLAEITPEDSVLDIGCTTGYSTAIFAKLAKKVVAIESTPDLASKANHALNSLGITNSIVISSNLTEGHPEGAPYDVIFFNGAIRSPIPSVLLDQLGEGGRLIAILCNNNHYNSLSPTVFGEITVLRRDKDLISKQHLLPVACFPLADFL